MVFCKITAIIRPEKLEAVEDVLKQKKVRGMTVSKVKGFGEYANFYTSDWLCTHVRVEVFAEAERGEEYAAAIMQAAYTGVEGDGIVAVSPVQSVYHVRLQKKCDRQPC